MIEQPKNLRVLSRQTIRELLNDDRCANAARTCQRAIRTLGEKGEPWSLLIVDILYERFRWCSERQGDVPLWNRGGQGYRARKAISKWRHAVEHGDNNADDVKVFMALLRNGACDRSELLDCCAPFERESDIITALNRLIGKDLVNVKMITGRISLSEHAIALAGEAIRKQLS